MRTLVQKRRSAPALLALCVALSACMGGADAVEVERGGFTFQITVDGQTAIARNYHTGQLNLAQLIESAQSAIETASGCAVKTLIKRAEINIFDATLICAE